MKRIVIKIGSSSLVSGTSNNSENLRVIAEVIAKLKKSGVEVVLVTSGAIATGVNKLGLNKKPMVLEKKQALAAIGQPFLIKAYEEFFEEYGLTLGQILVNHDDFGSRTRTTHLSDTFKALFDYGAVPVVNENDALTVEEIKVGDNDTLSAMVALISGADSLVLVTDVEGLFDGDPKAVGSKLIERVEKIDDKIFALAGGSGSAVGTGGMATKIKAAVIATQAGIETRIISADKLRYLPLLLSGENIGTYFCAGEKKYTIKQSWLINCATKSGKIFVDDGALAALKRRKSLLACGIIKTEGGFESGNVVSVCSSDGCEFAVGITYLNSSEIGSDGNSVVIHANNLALKV